MTDRHLQILEPVSVDQLEVAPHLSPSPRPPALNSDLLPDLHHWRSGMGGGRFTVDSGGGHTLGAIIRGTEGPGVRSYSSLDREDDLDLAVLAGVSGQVSSGGRSSHHESMIGMDDRALSSTECLSADPMLSKDAENSSTAPTPILISIPSISLAELPQDQTGVLLTGLHAQQESPEPCNLSHSLPGHFESRGNYPPFQLSHNYSSVPSSPDLSLPALGLDYYQSQPLSLEIQSSRDHINQSGICPSDLSDSHVERFQLRNSLLLGSTDLISPTQSDNLLSSSPIISASAPFSQYHLQHPPKGSPISSQISQPYCHVQYKPTPPNIPEVYGYIKSGLHNSTNTHHHSYHPSNSTARSAQLKINTLRVNSLSTQIIPKREENLNFFSHVSSDMSSGVNSFTKPIPHNYSPTSPVNLTHSGFQCTSNRVNLHSSGHSPPLSPTPSPLGLSDANPYKSLHLSNVLQDVPTLKDPSVPNSRNTHKKDVVYISDIKKSDVSKTKIPVHSSPSQTYGTKNEISSRSLHEDIAKTMNNILTSSPPSTATSSSFSPSSPVATTPLSNQNQSLCTKVSSSTNIGYQNLRTTSCNPTDDKFAVELWKLYGPSHQKLPPNSNALESLIRQLKEIGLDVDQIRKRWQSQGKGESNSPEPLAIAQDQCCSGSSSKSDVYNQKSEFLASFRPPEFKKLKTPPLDTLDPVQETKMSFGETPSCELKRGRVPKKALYAPRAGNRPEISPENEMDWRTQSRSRSRPPENAVINLKTPSLSRTRVFNNSGRITQGEGLNFSSSFMPPQSFNIKFELGCANTNHEKLRDETVNHLPGLSPMPCRSMLSQSVNHTSSTEKEMVTGAEEFSEKWSLYSHSPFYQLESIETSSKNSTASTCDSVSSPYTVLRQDIESNNHDDFTPESRAGQNAFFLARNNILESSPPAPAGMISDYDSFGFSIKPHFQNSTLGSIPGLNESFAKMANAHAEYGSIPRVVRKTSFDETLAHQAQKSAALGDFCTSAMNEVINPSVTMTEHGRLSLGHLERPAIFPDETSSSTLKDMGGCIGIHRKGDMEYGLLRAGDLDFHLNRVGHSLKSSESKAFDSRFHEYNHRNGYSNEILGNLSEGVENRSFKEEGEYHVKTKLTQIQAQNDESSAQVLGHRKTTSTSSGGSAQSHPSCHRVVGNGDISQVHKSSEFSGGRSVQKSTIAEARRRTKQLPYISWEAAANNDFCKSVLSPPTNENSKNSESSNSSGNQIQCLNCKTKETPLWRRDREGKPLCNACGLFVNLHGISRPAALSTGVIKRRNRAKNGDKEKSSQKPSQRS